MARRTIIAALVAPIVATAAPSPARAPGGLDRSYGRRGVAAVDLRGTDVARRVAVDPDGRTVMAGLSADVLAITRFDRNGRIDRSFSGDGIRRVRLGNWIPLWNVSLGVARDGSIIVGALVQFSEDPGAAVWRYRTVVFRLRPNGRIDRGFGEDGFFTAPAFDEVPADEMAVDLQVLRDGSIIVLGVVGEAAYEIIAVPSVSVLMKLTPDGILDEAFGVGGIAPAGYVGVLPAPRDLEVDRNGRIVVGSTRYEDPGGEDFLVQRFLPDGDIDLSFGEAGMALLDSGDPEWMWGIELSRDGSILAFGQTLGPEYGFWSVTAQLTPDGLPDPMFGKDGFRTYAFADASSIRDLVEHKGWLYALVNRYDDFAIARLSRSGSIDPSFGVVGQLGLPIEFAIALAASGRRLLAAGARWCWGGNCPDTMAAAAVRE